MTRLSLADPNPMGNRHDRGLHRRTLDVGRLHCFRAGHAGAGPVRVLAARAHKVSVKEAAAWSLVWVRLALVFNAGSVVVFERHGRAEIADRKALEFLTGYLIEKSLSVDNVFIFLLIFSSFHVPPEYQRRVLIYGVLGAIVLRAIMILAGAWVVREFNWVLYFFGAFLVVTGMRMLVMAEKTPDLEKNPVLKFARRHLRIAEGDHGEKFIVMKNGVRYFTPLFLVLILIEVTDLVFAVDSSRPFSPSPPIRSSSSPPTSSPSWACARCISCWPTWRTASIC